MTPWILIAVLVMLLRQFERWLHQHIFKVGWLVTKNYQTTTILYYTFFLPGVVLHELVYWLMAGLLNVRADRAIAWPEKQEIGELRLNFVKLSKRVGRIRLAVISAAPLVAGIVLVWLIVNNIFHLPQIMAEVDTGDLVNLGDAYNRIMATPDVWLWLYLLFTISNTMFPTNTKELQGWWLIGGVMAGAVVITFVLGVGDDLITNNLASPINGTLNALSGTFASMIVVSLFFTGILSLIENTIELITGDSATFKNGKMIVMRRSEVQALREQERHRERQRKTRQPASVGGLPSVYRILLPIPGPPGEEPVTQKPSAVVSPEKPALGSRPGAGGVRQGPDLIAGTARQKSTSPTTGTPPAQRLGAPSTVPGQNKPDLDRDEDGETSRDTSRPPLPTKSPVASFRQVPGSPPAGKPKETSETRAPDDFSRSRAGSPAKPTGTTELSASEVSPFSALRQPASSLPVRKPQDNDLDEEEEESGELSRTRPDSPMRPKGVPGAASTASPFSALRQPASSLPVRKPQDDDLDVDEEDSGKPSRTRAGSPPGGFSNSPKPGVSPFAPPGRPTSPFSARKPASEEDIDDEDDLTYEDAEDLP